MAPTPTMARPPRWPGRQAPTLSPARQQQTQAGSAPASPQRPPEGLEDLPQGRVDSRFLLAHLWMDMKPAPHAISPPHPRRTHPRDVRTRLSPQSRNATLAHTYRGTQALLETPGSELCLQEGSEGARNAARSWAGVCRAVGKGRRRGDWTTRRAAGSLTVATGETQPCPRQSDAHCQPAAAPLPPLPSGELVS